MLKILILALFLIPNFSHANKCLKYFKAQEYYRLDIARAFGIEPNQILSFRQIRDDPIVRWEILHRSKTGYKISRANAALDILGSKKVELSKPTLRALLDIPMIDRLLRAGFSKLEESQRSTYLKISDNHHGRIHQFVIQVTDNMIYQIYVKAPYH